MQTSAERAEEKLGRAPNTHLLREDAENVIFICDRFYTHLYLQDKENIEFFRTQVSCNDISEGSGIHYFPSTHTFG